MQPRQVALVDQAIRHALRRYDDVQGLLRSSEDPRFRVVQESLAFAGLLLVRASADRSRRSELGLARLLIDKVLSLQKSGRRDPDRGAFPIVWVPGASHSIVDPDSREVTVSMLGLLVREYAELLGEKRRARAVDAIRRAVRTSDRTPGRTTSAAMTDAWLELEFGNQWRGERLATQVALGGTEPLVERRFGDARAFARELWALGLWRRSNRLHDSVAELVQSILADIASCAHPHLPEIFGGVTTSIRPPDRAYSWLSAWMTWLEFGGEPMPPTSLADPLDSTLFAFPALAKLKLDAVERPPGPAVPAERTLERSLDDRTITGWWEDALHMEARESSGGEPSPAPVAGARWRAPRGQSVWMRARVSRREVAVCRKRFIHLKDPGTTIVSVHNMGEGETRMIENGWWLAGLHFATDGFRMLDARRSADSLELRLAPTTEQGVLMFSPLLRPGQTIRDIA
jgi:hypothetical protein